MLKLFHPLFFFLSGKFPFSQLSPRKMALQNRETAHRRIFGRWVNAWKMSLAFNATDHPVSRQERGKEKNREKRSSRERDAFSSESFFLKLAYACSYSRSQLRFAPLLREQKMARVLCHFRTCNEFVHKLSLQLGKVIGWKINDCSRAKMQFIIKMFPYSLSHTRRVITLSLPSPRVDNSEFLYASEFLDWNAKRAKWKASRATPEKMRVPKCQLGIMFWPIQLSDKLGLMTLELSLCVSSLFSAQMFQTSDAQELNEFRRKESFLLFPLLLRNLPRNLIWCAAANSQLFVFKYQSHKTNFSQMEINSKD